jgi:hypothetical protein
MADGGSTDDSVKSMLKATIETNLARERAINAGGELAIAHAHSNGVFFSRGGGFSNGIIFSRSGFAQALPSKEDESDFVQKLGELDEAAFTAFTDRLVRLREAKGPARGEESS